MMSTRMYKFYRPILDEDGASEGTTIEVMVMKDDKTGRDKYIDPSGKPLFTQDHMDTEVGKARTKSAGKNKEAIAALKEAQKRVGISEAAKDNLETEIENLKVAGMTKTQQQDAAHKKLQADHEKLQVQSKEAIGHFQGLFADEKINNELAKAADAYGAVSVPQIQMMLSSATKLEPLRDVDSGEPIPGKWVTETTFTELDDENKTVTATAPVAEAIERMSKCKLHYNLFKHGQKSGMEEGNVDVGENGLPDLRSMDFEQYDKFANDNPAIVGGDQGEF